MQEKAITFHVLVIAICLFFLMIPITAMIPVLQEITVGKFPRLSEFEKHLFMSVNMIGAFLFAPIIGIFSDYIKKRKTIIVTAFTINAAILFLMSLSWSYTSFLVLRFIEGCAHISALSLLMTLAMDFIKKGSGGRIMGFIGSAISLGVAFGAPLGGLIGQDNPQNVFIFGAILLLSFSFISFFLLKDIEQTNQNHPIRSLIDSILKLRNISIPYIFTFIDRLTVGFIISTLTFYLRLEMHASPKEIGFIMAIFLIPFSLLIYPSGKLSEKFNKLLLMIFGSLLYGIFLILIGFSTLDVLKILMLFSGLASALMYAPSLVLVYKMAGKNNKAVAMSGFNCAGSIGFIIGPLFGGSILTFFSTNNLGLTAYQLAFILIGGMEILCALLFLPSLRRIKL